MGALYWGAITAIGLIIGLSIIIVGGPWPVLPGAIVVSWVLGLVLFPKHLQQRSTMEHSHDYDNDNDSDDPLFV